MANTSDYTAQILVSRPQTIEAMGHELHFKEMESGPLHDELEVRAARGWSEERLEGWLTGALDDPEIVVAVEITADFEGWSVTATVGRLVEVV